MLSLAGENEKLLQRHPVKTTDLEDERYKLIAYTERTGFGLRTGWNCRPFTAGFQENAARALIKTLYTGAFFMYN